MNCIEFNDLSSDTKLMVGSIILEYLSPLLSTDPYLMEEQLVQFLFDLMCINRPNLQDIILNLIEIHFSAD